MKTMALTKSDLQQIINRQNKHFDEKINSLGEAFDIKFRTFRKSLFISLSKFLEEKLAPIPKLQKDVSKIKKDVSILRKDMREVKHEVEQIDRRIDTIYDRDDRQDEKITQLEQFSSLAA